MFKGDNPCDLLFIGEGPSQADDFLKEPFMGPAGISLENYIEAAGIDKYKLGFCHLTGCIAKDEDGRKRKTSPKKAWVKACQPRLETLIEICNPQGIICVGKFVEKEIIKTVNIDDYGIFSIVHPAASMRKDNMNQVIDSRRTMATFENIKRQFDG